MIFYGKTMSSTAKRKTLSIKDKLAILKKYDKEYPAKSQTELVKEFGIASSTLHTKIAQSTFPN